MTPCRSDIHTTPVPATVLGIFNNPYSDQAPQAVCYCDRCADMIGSLGFFTPKAEQ